MSALTVVGISCWFIIAFTSVAGILFMKKVFKQKGKIYYLILINFLTNLAMETSLFVLEFGIIGAVLIGVSFLVTFNLGNYIFVLRIKSLGGRVRFDNAVDYIMYPSIVVSVCLLVIGLINISRIFPIDVDIAIFTSFSLFCIVCVIEMYLLYILFSKIMIMFDYRQLLKRKLIWKLYLYTFIFFILEFAFLFVRVYFRNKNVPEDHIRVFSYNFRLFTVIDFYRDILSNISDESTLESSYLIS